MALEIEKKFLVDLQKLSPLIEGETIKQGYINTKDNTTVRVRIQNKKAFLTLKGKKQGASRLEFEYPIPLCDAEEILEKLCTGSVIDKTRYLIKHKKHTWELDVFYGENEGLVIAEVELTHEDEKLCLPAWVTKEVTHDTRYYNANLLHTPFSSW